MIEPASAVRPQTALTGPPRFANGLTPARVLAWSRLDTLLLGGIALAAGTIRLIRLGTPSEYMWDEFYAQDACFYLHLSPSICGTDQELTWTHPPLGKWLIASGIRVFGYTPFGWRIAPAVMGILAVVLLYLLARKILHSRSGAAVAAGLLAIDWLHFVQSRIAMLDIFVTTFAVAALLFLVYDRDRLLNGPHGAFILRHSSMSRPWRFLAGAAAGAALATKWSGALTLLTVLGLTACWEVAARRQADDTRAFRHAVKKEWLSVGVAFVALPFVIYLLSYAGNVHRSIAGDIQGTLFAWPWNEKSWFRDLQHRQVQMFEFHRTLVGIHLYASEGWSWPLLKRPALFFLDATGGRYGQVLALGNPLVWWPALATLSYIGANWIRRRDFAGPEGVILAGFAVSYLPLVYGARVRHLGFLYYLVTVVPSLCLSLAYVAVRARSSPRRNHMIAAGLVTVVAAFLFYYPLMSAVPVSRRFWELHILFRNCEGQVEPGFHGGPPPPGWCWI